MIKITFTSGTISQLDNEYYTLFLFNGEKRVYSATLPKATAEQTLAKHANIKMI